MKDDRIEDAIRYILSEVAWHALMKLGHAGVATAEIAYAFSDAFERLRRARERSYPRIYVACGAAAVVYGLLLYWGLR